MPLENPTIKKVDSGATEALFKFLTVLAFTKPKSAHEVFENVRIS
ncbi:hypothetical protein EST38_g11325 [Candolleomyces aberdarensis]|uniref:Uncharacterized protein n=1 Tax=Candolleomyces aberdarensis TaxID=2316362 RepID=A0A4Q2D7E9_9AGAR|nr:hypothetical protein EST38_g11325 [Candolleomyces aberdarensis]